MRETRAITVEQVLPYAAEKIWHTLTTSELIAKWLMPNDFVAAIGHRFNFRTRPMGDWNGGVRSAKTVALFVEGRLGFQRNARHAAGYGGDLDADAGRGRYASENGA
jgi:uncharacterized protein YndB with AHSA1/START domain